MAIFIGKLMIDSWTLSPLGNWFKVVETVGWTWMTLVWNLEVYNVWFHHKKQITAVDLRGWFHLVFHLSQELDEGNIYMVQEASYVGGYTQQFPVDVPLNQSCLTCCLTVECLECDDHLIPFTSFTNHVVFGGMVPPNCGRERSGFVQKRNTTKYIPSGYLT